MAKRKKDEFSAVKAVKANARERVGQPKPGQIIKSELKTGRAAKYKLRLEQVIEREE